MCDFRMVLGMDSAQIIEALKRLRVPHDVIADAIGRDRTAATKMLAGKRSIKVGELAPLTELVRKYEANGPSPAGPAPTSLVSVSDVSQLLLQLLPIRFRVQAGAWLNADVYATQDYGEGPIPADPRIPAEAQWLEEVVGESVNRLVSPGMLVHVIDPVAVGYTPREDDLVIIERKRLQGREVERTLKVARLGANGWEFWGDSTVEEFNVPIRIDEDPDSEVRIAGWVRHAIRRF